MSATDGRCRHLPDRQNETQEKRNQNSAGNPTTATTSEPWHRHVNSAFPACDKLGHGSHPCGRGGMADAEDLRENLSARRETGDAELLKFGETCNGNPEPSP